jgi:hypothetical protein
MTVSGDRCRVAGFGAEESAEEGGCGRRDRTRRFRVDRTVTVGLAGLVRHSRDRESGGGDQHGGGDAGLLATTQDQVGEGVAAALRVGAIIGVRAGCSGDFVDQVVDRQRVHHREVVVEGGHAVGLGLEGHVPGLAGRLRADGDRFGVGAFAMAAGRVVETVRGEGLGVREELLLEGAAGFVGEGDGVGDHGAGVAVGDGAGFERRQGQGEVG